MDKISAETIIKLSNAGYSADDINKIVDALKPSEQENENKLQKDEDVLQQDEDVLQKDEDVLQKDEETEKKSVETEKDSAEVENLKKEIKDLQERNRRQAQSPEDEEKKAYEDLINKISSF